MADLVVVTPLRIEARAVRGPVQVSGAGRDRARVKGRALAATCPDGTAVAVVGVGGGLDPNLVPGQLVVATEVRDLEGTVARRLPGADLLASELRRGGLDAVSGPVVSSPVLVRGAERSKAAASGARVVDMESAWMAEALEDRPVAVVRAVADTGARGMVLGGMRALGSLRRVRPALERWAAAVGTRDVVLAAPRSFCAGVERAIEVVDRALERFGAPVYVRRQIVHNAHVVRQLEAKGAVFVREIEQVPDGGVVVLAAHGVSPAVRRDASARRDLTVIDATCPLVAKVHNEARRFAAQGFHIVLVGHGDHEEVVGTLGEAPDRTTLIEHAADVAALRLAPGTPVAYLTQTTLATDETDEVVGALRQRFPDLVGPSANDICYATQNRQDAVRAIAGRCDTMLVVGSANSSNTARLVEVARREGCAAHLVEDASSLQLAWLDGATTVGLTAGASAPESLVQEVVDALAGLGPVTVDEIHTVDETARFTLPAQVR